MAKCSSWSVIKMLRKLGFPVPSLRQRYAYVKTLGHKRYQARWTDPAGKQRSKIFQKKSDAEKHLTSVQHAMLSGSYVDPAAGKITVGAMADTWLSSKVNLKASTRARYESALDVHVRKRWGTTPLARVDHGSVQAWVDEMAASGASAAQVRKIVSVLSGVLALAVRTKRLASNPCDGVELPRTTERPPKYLTASQVANLAREAATLPSGRPKRATDAAFQQYRLVVLVLAYCGLRWGELAALRVSNVDLLRKRLHVTASVTEVNGSKLVWGTPKNHEARWVPVPRFLADEIAVHLAGKATGDLVFTSPDGSVLRNRNARRAWFDRAASAIGVEGLTPHELRHTAASLAVSAGANVKAVQRMLGHASAVLTLDRYADLFDADLDAVAERLDAIGGLNLDRDDESSVNLASVASL